MRLEYIYIYVAQVHFGEQIINYLFYLTVRFFYLISYLYRMMLNTSPTTL